MVRKSYKRKRTFRKRAKKTYKKRRSLLPRSVMVGTIPDRMFVTLKYNDRYILTGTTGSLGVQRFSCNGLHDVDLTGTGHQPLYYDQLVNSLEGNGLYHKYMVHSMSYSIKSVNTDTSVEQTHLVIPTPHGNTVTNTDNIDALCEAPYAVRRITSTATGGSNQAHFSGSVSIKRIEGVSRLDRSGYQATAGNVPLFQPQLTFVSAPMNETSSHNCLIDVTLYFKVEIFDRIFRRVVS